VLERFADRPLVDEYVELLWAAITQTWPGLRRRRPGFRLRLTHDIDNPWAAWRRPTRRVLRALGGDLIRRHDPGLAARRLRAWSDARTGRWDRDPYHTYDVLARVSERAGLRSTFYFMAAGPEGQRAPHYRITDRPFAAILRQIHERGHEIGLHASYEAYRSADALRLEHEALATACRAAGFEPDSPGVRQHYLRFANPDTWRFQAAAGLAHDSSIGFTDRIGFRSGTCREHRVFDLVAGRALDLHERPLLAMDAAMFDELRLRPSDAAASVKALVERCRAMGGDAVLLVHNDRVAGSRPLAWYRELVQELARPAGSHGAAGRGS
jgi:peptidoglycan/xylan/chitin deacetylase (PgdA/CDA1 family)